MSRGKSRTRKARVDMMRSRAAMARKKQRQYDRQQYDKPASEES
ncbi:MAG: hypothetical protein A4E44_00148 [Methanosaeta sp. PtaB.Bin018]|nr:MAG: hypothetical protein A4E44_00148 [Methanosaeta sp. PtaB.Bin018]OPY48120.1 MAG: hypothetical protein A4E46_00095 [Methanosaeta sp. PtaU1.Bin016]